MKTNIINDDNKFNFYELGCEIINNITYLFLYHYDKTNTLINKIQFSKVAEKQQDVELAYTSEEAWGLQYMVNKKLFSGNFILIDSLNRKTKIKFNDNGSLTDFYNFNTYYIQTDFLGDSIWLYEDLIILKNKEFDSLEIYAFQIKKDTVYLYSVIPHEEIGLPFKLDKLKYKLVRK